MTLSLDPQTARAIVCDYMHYSGSCRNILTASQHDDVYSLADGFGRIGRRALRMHYDWSHIRDSSDEAMVAMAQAVTAIVNGKAAA